MTSEPSPSPAPVPTQRGAQRRWILAAIALGVVIALAAAIGAIAPRGSRQPTPAPTQAGAGSGTMPATQREQEINAALARMNTALRQRDEAGYVSVVLPGRIAFLAHERAVFHALTRVPFTDVHYWWWHDEFMPEVGLEQFYHAPAFVAHVIRSYTLGGWDAKPVAEPQGLTFVQQPSSGHWYLAGDADGDATLPDGAFSEPWTIGDVSVARTAHILVIGDPGAAARTRRLAARIERLLRDVAQMWPGQGVERQGRRVHGQQPPIRQGLVRLTRGDRPGGPPRRSRPPSTPSSARSPPTPPTATRSADGPGPGWC